MFCKKCGNALDDGMKFCPQCGEPVVNTAAQEAPPATDEAEPDIVYQTPEPEAYEQTAAAETGGEYGQQSETGGEAYQPPDAGEYQPPVYQTPPAQGVQRSININIKTPAFLSGGDRRMWLGITFLLAACTMICMILSGVAVSAMGFGLSLPNTSIGSIMGKDAGAFGVYTVFLVIYIIINLCAVFMIFCRIKYGTLAGLAANLIAVIFSIVVIAASFLLSTDMGGFIKITTKPTIWAWLALVLGLADGAFLVLKGADLTQ